MEMTDSISALAKTSSVAPTAGVSADTKDQTAQTSPSSASTTQTPATSADADQAVRLVIEPVSGGTGYTYKLFDRATGELLVELPREDARKMSEDPGYSAGQVFSTKA